MNVTKIIDILTFKNVEEYYNLYNDTQWFNESEMKLFQLNKLRKLINHCYLNVPFYRDFMMKNSIKPDDIQTLEKINLFPVINKEIIKKHYSEFIPYNIKKIKGVKIGQTGGTTGNILFKRTDSNVRSSTWAVFKRFQDWMGLKQRDKKLILMGGHVTGHNAFNCIKKIFLNFLTNSVSYNPYDTSEENFFDIFNSLKKENFKHIRSYSQYLFFLSRRIKKLNCKFQINSISTTAEPLIEDHRKLFKEVFNANTFDQYGFGEIGGVAFECDNHKGLHITEERVVVEVNDSNELIITDLDNYSMPYIRYWNADQAIFDRNKCSCGRKSKLLKKIMGRTCDYIIGLNGQYLHWAYFWHLIFDSEIAKNRNLTKFQVVQEEKDKITIKLISDILSDVEKKKIISNIQSRLGNINITFSFEKEIENTISGKYRPVINKLLT